MQIKRLKLKKLNNTRDLGGFPTVDGRRIKGGKLIRSGKLSNLPDKTVSDLKQIGLTTIIDLRIPTEKSEYPDTVIEGVNYIELPLIYTPTFGITTEKSTRIIASKESRRIKQEFGGIDNYMIETYRSILFNEQPQQVLKQFLRKIVEEDGCVLWHCSGGKDRAGVCAMLIEGLLGVEEEVIIQDYIATGKICKQRYNLNRFVLSLAPLTPRFRKILFGFMRVKRLYFETIINDMKERYGGIEGYCKQVLDITDEDIKILKTKYLV